MSFHMKTWIWFSGVWEGKWVDLGLGFKVLRFKAAPKTRETMKESKLIQKLGGFFFLLMCDFLCFFASCSVCCCFFILHLFLAPLMFHTFHLALLLILCCYYLRWCVISRLALLLFVLVHCPHLALLLFVVVLLLCVLVVVVLHLALSLFVCHCHYLALPLLAMVPRLALLFLVMVLHLALLLLVVSFALHYYCLLWFILFTLFCHSTRFPNIHPTFFCVITICCGLWFLTLLCCYLFVEVMYFPTPLAMCRFLSLELDVLF